MHVGLENGELKLIKTLTCFRVVHCSVRSSVMKIDYNAHKMHICGLYSAEF